MATKYSMRAINLETNEETPLALLSDDMGWELLQQLCEVVSHYTIGSARIEVIDMDTGEVEAEFTSSDNDYDEPDNIDDDCGFDPYMGCYTDDC